MRRTQALRSRRTLFSGSPEGSDQFSDILQLIVATALATAINELAGFHLRQEPGIFPITLTLRFDVHFQSPAASKSDALRSADSGETIIQDTNSGAMILASIQTRRRVLVSPHVARV
jgi:hypothetical protein